MTFNPPNYTQTPNELFALQKVMKEAELRVTLVIVRETFGWNAGNQAALLPLQYLQDETGMSKQGVLNGLDAGRKRGTIRSVKEGRDVYYGLSVRDVHLPDKGQLSRPKLVNLVDPTEAPKVNEVDRKGQLSRPKTESKGQRSRPNESTRLTQMVNEVDRKGQPSRPITPDSSAPGAEETGAERQRNTVKDNETQVTTTTPANDEIHSVGSGGGGGGGSSEAVEGQDETQQTPGGASAEAAHAAQLGTARPDQVKNEPPAGVNDDATSTEDVPAARRAALEAAFAPWKLERTLNKILGREADWLTIPAQRIQELHAEAVKRFKSRYRGDLEGMLDDEAQRLATPQPSPQDELDVDALFDAAPLTPVTNSTRSAK